MDEERKGAAGSCDEERKLNELLRTMQSLQAQLDLVSDKSVRTFSKKRLHALTDLEHELLTELRELAKQINGLRTKISRNIRTR